MPPDTFRIDSYNSQWPGNNSPNVKNGKLCSEISVFHRKRMIMQLIRRSEVKRMLRSPQKIFFSGNSTKSKSKIDMSDLADVHNYLRVTQVPAPLTIGTCVNLATCANTDRHFLCLGILYSHLHFPALEIFVNGSSKYIVSVHTRYLSGYVVISPPFPYFFMTHRKIR